MDKKGKAGRPLGSEIRNNIIEIIYVLGKAYAYEVYKYYIQIFPKTTLRNVYYHLKKGVQNGEIKVAQIKKEKGNYSWGNEAEKIYYELDKNSKPKLSERIVKKIEEIKNKK